MNMSLISLDFGVFFFIMLFVYFLVPLKLQWWVLLTGSILFFLLTTTPYTILFLLFSITSVYFASSYITQENALHKKRIFFGTIAANVTLLVFQKYVNGTWASIVVISQLFGISLPAFYTTWVAPLGMSFYTLQLIGYLTDVYWEVCSPQRSFAKLALFASYFPSLGSGPILRYSQVMSTLYDAHRANYKSFTFGLQRMLWGIFKKVVLAIRLEAIAAPIFANPNPYTGLWIWIGSFFAVIQIYADFSGNMDFILGVSECFGIRLPENFRQPFFSLNTQEFWQRWHITLGTWLKDYVMSPLLRSKPWLKLGAFLKKHVGKKVAKMLPIFLALLVLWLVNGIWHAPYPRIIATVLWFWLTVVTGQLFKAIWDKILLFFNVNRDCFSWRLLQRIRTCIIYAIGALFFYAPNLTTALKMIRQSFRSSVPSLLNNNTILSTHFLTLCDGWLGLFILSCSILLVLFVEASQNQNICIREWLAKQNLIFRWGLLLFFIFYILLFGIYGPGYHAADFIYAGF